MHIVFHQEDAKTLIKSFDLDDSLRQEVYVILDDYSFGPFKQVITPGSLDSRKEWWNKIKGEDPVEMVNSPTDEDLKTMGTVKNLLDKNPKEDLRIWVGANKRDVCGYYWMVSQLSDYTGRVLVLHLNNLPFINEKGTIFYPEYLFQILPKEFLKAKKLARNVTTSEFEIDSDEWLRLGNENKTVRILEGAKKLSQYNADYFDDFILQFINTDWQKVAKIMSQSLSKSKVSIDETFALWRIKRLIDDREIEAQGDINNKKEFEIKKSFIRL